MTRKTALLSTYLLGFLFYIHSYLPIYLHSSFLSQFVIEKSLGFIFTISSILAIIFLPIHRKIIGAIGNTKALLFAASVQFVFYMILSQSEELAILLPTFIFSQALVFSMLFNIDIYLESSSTDKSTGSIRGTFLTIINFVVACMPLIAGEIAEKNTYGDIYFYSALALIPVVILLLLSFRTFKDKPYKKISLWAGLGVILQNPDLKKIFICNLMLRFFYAIMVIYMPLYLHTRLGFEWGEIGLIFTIMLLPFVLFELPLGKIADHLWGEKEILSVGYIISGLLTLSLFFISSHSILIWATVLFLTRVGASFIEIMTETYFFKKIDAEDASIISLYRTVEPLGYTLAPFLSSLVLIFVDIRYVFLILGVLLLTTTMVSRKLHDTL